MLLPIGWFCLEGSRGMKLYLNEFRIVLRTYLRSSLQYLLWYVEIGIEVCRVRLHVVCESLLQKIV